MITETTFYRVRRTVDGKHQYLQDTSRGDWVSSARHADTWSLRTDADYIARRHAAKTITVRHKLVPAKPRGRSWAWALRQLHKGRKVQRLACNLIVFHQDAVGRILYSHVPDGDKGLFSFHSEHLEATDWVLA